MVGDHWMTPVFEFRLIVSWLPGVTYATALFAKVTLAVPDGF
jgi:hypothetical protein